MAAAAPHIFQEPDENLRVVLCGLIYLSKPAPELIGKTYIPNHSNLLYAIYGIFVKYCSLNQKRGTLGAPRIIVRGHRLPSLFRHSGIYGNPFAFLKYPRRSLQQQDFLPAARIFGKSESGFHKKS